MPILTHMYFIYTWVSHIHHIHFLKEANRVSSDAFLMGVVFGCRLEDQDASWGGGQLSLVHSHPTIKEDELGSLGDWQQNWANAANGWTIWSASLRRGKFHMVA